MCGISGFANPRGAPGQRLEHVVRSMTRPLAHRGPDDEGVWVDQEAGVALGHRRLSIIDLSETGHQPMVSSCGRYVLVFNGEIYNFQSLRLLLERDRVRFRGSSDTEVLLEGFSRWGIQATIKRSDGMFALAVWDRRERVLTLGRDRLGEKPLFYGWMGSAFLFASEMKALVQHPDFRLEIDRTALALFLRRNCVPAPYSICEDIRKLPPGTTLALNPERARVLPLPVHYWSLQDVVERGSRGRLSVSDEEATDRLDELLRSSVLERMIADVPLGAFLSGGVDSSTIVALMQHQSKRPVKTFTIGFDATSFNEAGHAKAVASHLGTDHTELYVTGADALGVVPQLPALYDEPFSDSSQIPTFLVSRLARTEVKVALSGDGGDEVFGGYNRYVLYRNVFRRMRHVPTSLRRAVATGIEHVSPERWDALLRPARRVLPGALGAHPGDKLHKAAGVLVMDSPRAMYDRLISHWSDSDSVVRGAQSDYGRALDGVASEALRDPVDRMMYLDTLTYLPDDILTKVDRATMATSLEARVPFLDHEIVEFAWRLPQSMKIRGGETKYLLRRVLDRYVPRPLIDRPKMGFGVPLREWLRGPLRDWAESLIAPDRLAREGLLEVGLVRRKWTEHLEGTRDWKYDLWDVLMFEAWLESMSDRGARRASPG